MSAHTISPRAQADIDDIWDYTAEPCDHLRLGYRKYSVVSHLLFFCTMTNGIEIVRILHQSMDFERHL
jgi:toxin ParE1/3/4